MNLAHAIMALISFHRDDLTRAAAAAQAANQELTGRGTSSPAGRLAACPAAGGFRPARAALETLNTPLRQSARLGIRAEFPVVGADLVRLAVTEGDISLARRVAAAVGDVASRNDVAWLRVRRCGARDWRKATPTRWPRRRRLCRRIPSAGACAGVRGRRGRPRQAGRSRTRTAAARAGDRHL